jgi:hypothetical protein
MRRTTGLANMVGTWDARMRARMTGGRARARERGGVACDAAGRAAQVCTLLLRHNASVNERALNWAPTQPHEEVRSGRRRNAAQPLSRAPRRL